VTKTEEELMAEIATAKELQAKLTEYREHMEKFLLELDPDGQMRQAMTMASTEELYTRARSLLTSRQMDEALEAFTQLVLCAPHNPRFQFGLGLCLHHFGRIVDASRHYGLAYIMNPSDAACAFRLAECLESAGDLIEAKDAYLAALQLCDVPGAPQQLRPHAQAGIDRVSA